jgi:hypothetical protein
MKTKTQIPTQASILALWQTLTTKVVNIQDLVSTLNAKRSACFISIKALTECQASQAKGAQVIHKLAYVNGLIHTVYENGVLRQMEREEIVSTWETNPLTWGVKEGCIVSHTPKKTGVFTQYVQMRPMQIVLPSKFFINGNEVSKDSVEHLIKAPSFSKKQAQAGIEKQIPVRCYALENVLEIAINGERYSIE